MEVRVVGHLPAPGVERRGEADACGAEEAGVALEIMERARGGEEERRIRDPLMRAHEGPELLGQREGQKEVGHVQAPCGLLGEPAVVFGGLALWTVSIAAGARRLVRAARAVAVPANVSECAGAAGAEDRDDAPVLDGHGGAVTSEVLLAVPADDVAEGRHGASALEVDGGWARGFTGSLRHERIDLGVGMLLPVARGDIVGKGR